MARGLDEHGGNLSGFCVRQYDGGIPQAVIGAELAKYPQI